jgi:hypothetical protein
MARTARNRAEEGVLGYGRYAVKRPPIALSSFQDFFFPDDGWPGRWPHCGVEVAPPLSFLGAGCAGTFATREMFIISGSIKKLHPSQIANQQSTWNLNAPRNRFRYCLAVGAYTWAVRDVLSPLHLDLRPVGMGFNSAG